MKSQLHMQFRVWYSGIPKCQKKNGNEKYKISGHEKWVGTDSFRTMKGIKSH